MTFPEYPLGGIGTRSIAKLCYTEITLQKGQEGRLSQWKPVFHQTKEEEKESV